MNLKLTVAAGLLAAVSGVVLAQGTINTNNFVNNTKASNTKASQSYFTPAANKTAKKKGWQFSYNGAIGYGSSEDLNGDKSDNLTPFKLGLSVQNGGFYAGVLGDYESSEFDTDINTGYVYKMSKSILLAANYEYTAYGDDSGDSYSTVGAAGAWNGLGLGYNQDLGDDEAMYQVFYMKKFGANHITFNVSAPTDNPDDIMGYGMGYDYNFRQDYRVGVEYAYMTAKDYPVADASAWYVTLSKGLDFDGITNAMRHYM
jgi:hypothetical protein